MQTLRFVAVLAVVVLLFVVTEPLSVSAADPVEGFWTSIDEKSNKSTAYWEFTVEEGELKGVIVKLPEEDDPEALCVDCSGEYKNMPVIGTTWLHLKKKNRDGSWEDGFIIDSENGKQYRAKVWVEEGDLRLRGYVGFFHRTQTWKRTDDPR